jgi:hypothetical protein
MVSAPDPLVDRGNLGIAEWAVPNWRSSAVFDAKVAVHRTVRLFSDLATNLCRWEKSADGDFPAILGESRTKLWSDERPEEHRYQLGKVQNLRRAAALLDRVVVPAGEVFSFWKQIGRAVRRRGFVTGRMLQQGCLVPATGGGLCQLSNAIYEAALQSGCAIVERHAHSRAVAGSAAVAGRDATVAWNYVDLRFRPPTTLQIEAHLTRDELVIRFRGVSAVKPPSPQAAEPISRSLMAARSCATCGETSCFRHEPHAVHPAETGHTAFLVDENWPEFQDYVRRAHRSADILGLPLDGAKWRMPRYAWRVDGFARKGAASLQALARTIAIRRAPTQGAARRHAELTGAERIAKRLARLLAPEVTRVCVAQSLLPYLWRDGYLGGREVEVLMTRLPMAELQARLDRAVEAHPDRATLGDFRAPPALVAAEAEALAYASRIVTPHAEIARLFAEKATLLDWQRPSTRAVVRAARPNGIAFAGPTIARKGAYAVRDAAKALGLEIVVFGSDLEGPGFWGDVAVRKLEPGADWLDGVAAVIQPAIVEERPRPLLMALAAGVSVIASPACGLAVQNGLTLVAPDDADALIAALKTVLPQP